MSTKQPERRLVEKIRKRLKERLPKNHFVMKLADRYTRGLPDILVILPKPHAEIGSLVLAFEVKTMSGKISLLQARTIDQLCAAGVSCYLVRSAEQLDQILDGVGY